MNRLTVDTVPYYETEFEHFPFIVQADQENRKLQIAYENEEGKRSVRQVTPLHLYRSKEGYKMTLKAFDDKSQEVRNFTVNRILALDLGERLPETPEQAAVRYATAQLEQFGIPMDAYNAEPQPYHESDGYVRVNFVHKVSGKVILTRVADDGFVTAPTLHLRGYQDW